MHRRVLSQLLAFRFNIDSWIDFGLDNINIDIKRKGDVFALSNYYLDNYPSFFATSIGAKEPDSRFKIYKSSKTKLTDEEVDVFGTTINL